jgi:hypothetical protein
MIFLNFKNVRHIIENYMLTLKIIINKGMKLNLYLIYVLICYLPRLDILRSSSVNFVEVIFWLYFNICIVELSLLSCNWDMFCFASIEINLCSSDEEILSISNSVWFWYFAMMLLNSCLAESALLKKCYKVLFPCVHIVFNRP